MLQKITTCINTKKYIIFFDDRQLTVNHVLRECAKCIQGDTELDASLTPHYLIVPEAKSSILNLMEENISDEAYQRGYNARMEAEEYFS